MKMKVNLLPTKMSRKKAGAMYELGIMAGAIVATLIGLYMWYYVMDSTRSELNVNINHVKSQISKLKKEVVRVDEFKRKAKSLESKLKVIKDLRARKTGPVKILDDLATTITKVGDVWLLSLNEVEGVMTLEMNSLRQDKISEFMEMLEKESRYFSDIKLVITESKTEKNLIYYYFKISCKVNYGLVKDRS